MLLSSVVARARCLHVPSVLPRATAAPRVSTSLATAMSPRLLRQPMVRMMCTAERIPGVTYNDEGVAVNDDGEPLSKTALKKAAKLAATAAKKAAKKAEKAASAGDENQGGGTQAAEIRAEDEPAAPYSFSAPGVLMSDASLEVQQRVYSTIRDLGTPTGVPAGQEVWVRGRLSTLRAGASNAFLVLRSQGQYTVQACFFKSKETPNQSKAMLLALAGLTEESIVDVRGSLVDATVKGCSQSNVEIQIADVVLVSSASRACLPCGYGSLHMPRCLLCQVPRLTGGCCAFFHV
jgi:hypothetical protein